LPLAGPKSREFPYLDSASDASAYSYRNPTREILIRELVTRGGEATLYCNAMAFRRRRVAAGRKRPVRRRPAFRRRKAAPKRRMGRVRRRRNPRKRNDQLTLTFRGNSSVALIDSNGELSSYLPFTPNLTIPSTILDTLVLDWKEVQFVKIKTFSYPDYGLEVVENPQRITTLYDDSNTGVNFYTQDEARLFPTSKIKQWLFQPRSKGNSVRQILYPKFKDAFGTSQHVAYVTTQKPWMSTQTMDDITFHSDNGNHLIIEGPLAYNLKEVHREHVVTLRVRGRKWGAVYANAANSSHHHSTNKNKPPVTHI